MDNKIKNLLLLTGENLEWEKIMFSTKISDSGSSRPAMFLENKNGEIKPFRPVQKKIIFEIDDIATMNFKSFQTDLLTRFNTVEFEIYKDGSYKANYSWDEAEDKEQKLKTAEVFPIWLHERFLQFLFEAGNGDNKKWQRGILEVKIDENKNIRVGATLFNKEKPFQANFEFPQVVFDAILYHHEITNFGLLSDTWQKWNTLIIQTRNTSVDLEKDVVYRLEDSI